MLLNYKILDVHVFYYSYLFKGDTKYHKIWPFSKRNYFKLKTILLPSFLYVRVSFLKKKKIIQMHTQLPKKKKKKPKILDFYSFELILVGLHKK